MDSNRKMYGAGTKCTSLEFVIVRLPKKLFIESLPQDTQCCLTKRGRRKTIPQLRFMMQTWWTYRLASSYLLFEMVAFLFTIAKD